LFQWTCRAAHDHKPSARQPKPIARTLADDFFIARRLASNHVVAEKKREHEN